MHFNGFALLLPGSRYVFASSANRGLVGKRAHTYASHSEKNRGLLASVVASISIGVFIWELHRKQKKIKMKKKNAMCHKINLLYDMESKVVTV